MDALPVQEVAAVEKLWENEKGKAESLPTEGRWKNGK